MNKLIGLTITVALAVGLIGCSAQSLATSTNVDNLINDTNKETLLEVSTQSEGMVYPLGTILEIKLYSTGEAEMDYYLTSLTVPTLNEHIPTKTLRKNVVINKSDFQQLKALIEMADFVKASSQYLPTFPYPSDVSTTTTIIFKYKEESKKIVLKESDNNLYLEKKKGVYPDSLINLLKLITKLRVEFEK